MKYQKSENVCILILGEEIDIIEIKNAPYLEPWITIPIITCSFNWLCCVTFQSKKALKNILQKCVHLPALEPLLHDAPPNILKHVVGQFSKVLPHDSKARRLFVTSAGLKKIQEIKAEPGSALAEYVNTINNCYPEEIVK